MSNRQVLSVVNARYLAEGDGFIVRRPMPSAELPLLDPLLLLDELGPVEYGPGQAVGATDHPHRGFETVTYIMEGEGAHSDSAGNTGTIGPGDVQWMTAGDGVVHREMPSRRIQERGGRVHGFQLWVNLPRSKKRVAPRYQEIKSSSIPQVEMADGSSARVIAGSAFGLDAVAETHSPVLYVHCALTAGGLLETPVPTDHSVCVYVFDGAMQVGSKPVTAGQLAILGDGAQIRLSSDKPSQALILGGRPLGDPVARMGPFVMNTQAEIREAIADFQAGRMGTIRE